MKINEYLTDLKKQQKLLAEYLTSIGVEASEADLLNVLIQKIYAGGIVMVDQEYKPKSENAQSGKAVAEALAAKQDKFAEIIEANNNFDEAQLRKKFRLKSIKGKTVIVVNNDGYADFVGIGEMKNGNSMIGLDYRDEMAYVNARFSFTHGAEILNTPVSANDIVNKKYVDEAVANGIGDKITVDQTYSPNSENAQSGVAIAGVIGDIETALTNIEAIQDALISGGNA